MKFAICNEIFDGWSLPDTFAFAKKAGYHGVEIAPFTVGKRVTDVTARQRREIREAAQRAGIEISGIHWVLAKTEGLHLTHPDKKVRVRTARYLLDLVDFCGDLGGSTVVFGSPKQRDVLPGVEMKQALQWAAEGFRYPVNRAQEKRITICFEPLAPSETNFINTAADAIRFTKKLASSAFKILLDVKAMCSESKPIPQIIRESRRAFGYFHANDRNLKGPGFGDVDFKPIAAALKEVEYDGWVSVEVFNFEEGPEAIATRSREYLKKVFGK